jgi:hypothetical protein
LQIRAEYDGGDAIYTRIGRGIHWKPPIVGREWLKMAKGDAVKRHP